MEDQGLEPPEVAQGVEPHTIGQEVQGPGPCVETRAAGIT